MKKLTILSIAIVSVMGITMMIIGCATSKTVTAKSGMQLWGENCIRCHNAPSPGDYSNAQWETIGMHMKLRANLTDVEATRIVEFLKSAN